MTDTYGLCTFSSSDNVRRAGLVIDERIAALDDLIQIAPKTELTSPAGSVLALLERWEQVLPSLNRLAETARSRATNLRFYRFDEVHMHAPVDLPRQIFCTGANYRQHVIDMTLDMNVGPPGLDKVGLRRWAEDMMDERAAKGEPYVFTKPVSAVAGAFDPLVVPTNTKQLDWEIELGVVIGKGGWHIPRDKAFEHIAGYAIVNDISARDLIARADYKMLGTDWLKAKGQVGFLPFGPCLIPAIFVPEPERLKLKLSVNGKLMQNESSADMIFGIARQIEYISSYTRLLPGDLICTGSPAGNGTHHNKFLQPGDVMTGEIERLGLQQTTCVGVHE